VQRGVSVSLILAIGQDPLGHEILASRAARRRRGNFSTSLGSQFHNVGLIDIAKLIDFRLAEWLPKGDAG
jgi:hypothetical protein